MSTTAQDDTAAIKGKENQKGATDSSLPALPLNEVTGEFMDEIIEEEDGTRYTERLKRVKRPSICSVRAYIPLNSPLMMSRAWTERGAGTPISRNSQYPSRSCIFVGSRFCE